MKIVVDTREKRALWKSGVVVKKLDVGDYSLLGKEHLIAIERKSMGDLYQTLGQGHKRFKKELERALQLEYFAIVVEDLFDSCKFKHFRGSEYSKMSGGLVTKILFTINMKYNIPIFFCNGRMEAKLVIEELFEAYLRTKGGK